jgi:integrase
MKRELVRWTGYRSALGAHIEAYVVAKRALGMRFAIEERTLRLLDRFVAARGLGTVGEVTAVVVDEFLSSRPRHSARSYNHLQGTVRRLLDWMAIQGISGVVRYRGYPRREAGRRRPVLFTDTQVRQLLDAAARLVERSGYTSLAAATYRMAFAVLYCLGLRVGEVSRLRLGDVDLRARTLVVRRTKFGKDRLVPFGPRLARELEAYLATRRGGRMPANAAVFPGARGPALSTHSLRGVFGRLCRDVRIGASESGAPPRVHDLRHSFAVATLLHWYEAGLNPTEKLLQLSTGRPPRPGRKASGRPSPRLHGYGLERRGTARVGDEDGVAFVGHPLVSIQRQKERRYPQERAGGPFEPYETKKQCDMCASTRQSSETGRKWRGGRSSRKYNRFSSLRHHVDVLGGTLAPTSRKKKLVLLWASWLHT